MITFTTITRKALTFGAVTVLAISTANHAVAQSDGHRSESQGMMKKKMMSEARLGLEGYCPVCIIDARKWEKGRPDIVSTFDGVKYYFPSAAIKAKFDKNPVRYVPALNGDCIVCLEKADKRMAGNVRHAALHNNRLYLFPGEKEKQMFVREPNAYSKTDLAANGECIVCLVKMKKHVPGSTEHTVLHDGLRYLFPSSREADVFKASPQQFLSTKMDNKKPGMIKTSMESTAGSVEVAGRSGCAACEFGVTPVGAPDELGLAIVGNNGHITVVENAHRDYPGIYKDRFQSQQLVAKGEVIKQKGNITWIKPSSLRLVP